MGSEWQQFCLADAGSIVTGKTPRGGIPEFEGSDVPFVTPPDFNGSMWIERANRSISELGAQSVKGSIIPRCSVLVTCIGSDMGKAALTASRCVTNQQINAVLVDETKFCPEFIYYNLSLRKDEIRGLAGGSAQPILNKSAFSQIRFWAPPLSEQRTIATALRPINDRIALLRETNATLEAIAQALFKSWFVDFDPVHARARGEQPAGLTPEVTALFPDCFEESALGMIPKGWSWSVLGNVCTDHGGTIQTGPFGSQLHASDYVQEGTPVVMPKDISGRRVDGGTAARIGMADVERLFRHQLQIGDIVFSRRGDVEKHALIGELEQGWLCGTGCLLVRPGKNWSSPGFLSRLLDLQSTKRWLTQHAVGATMPNLNTGILAAVPVLLPSREVLMEFEQLTHVLDTRISENNATIQTLANLRDTLLPRLISGQLRLPDAEAMVSEAQA